MNYMQWASIYKQILADFSYSTKKDIESAKILDNLLTGLNKKLVFFKLNELIKNKEIWIFGAGPSLEKSIKKQKNNFLNKTKIAADGATSALLKYDIIPDIIITDLDGKVIDQIKANKAGSVVILHAHGDNIDKIKSFTTKFNKEKIGTTQTDPSLYKNLFNFGGFSDGDRAVFMATHFQAKKINLVGFDYNNEIGEYSFAENKDKKIKIKKLKWCKRLIEKLNGKNQNIEYL